MSPFSTTFITDYLNVNPDATITLPRFIGYVQEASLRHCEQAGYPLSWFSEHRQGFLLTHWQIRVMGYPLWNREIKINTWPMKMRGFIAERAFTATDENGTPLLFANSSWVYMDLAGRKPLRMTSEILESYGTPAPSELPRDYKLPLIKESELKTIREDSFTITRHDIDTNLHVNNQKYLEWALDYIPDEVYNKRRVTDMKISYKKECLKDQTVLVETRKRMMDDNEKEEFVTLIRDFKDRDCILTEVWSSWK